MLVKIDESTYIDPNCISAVIANKANEVVIRLKNSDTKIYCSCTLDEAKIKLNNILKQLESTSYVSGN